MENETNHLLKILAKTDDSVGEYVSYWLENHFGTDTSDLIDAWFKLRAAKYIHEPDLSPNVDPNSHPITFESTQGVSPKIRLISVQPNYFRGFRKLEVPINLRGDLVVLDGRNSSGKTSLAEAIEWILTGHIVRRELGDPKELAACITNRFKPNDEETWVELILDENGNQRTLRRTLIRDYDSKKNSSCETRVLLDGSILDTNGNSHILETWFSGVLPLLMQHTLRQFVLDTPEKRRDYFERLLNLDQITHLIEKSVVGDARLDDFPSASGSIMLAEWQHLKEVVSAKNIALFRKVERSGNKEIKETLQDALHNTAVGEFSIESSLPYDAVLETIRQMQRSVRQQKFPQLERLRPQRKVDEMLSSQLAEDAYDTQLSAATEAYHRYQIAESSAQAISSAQIAISASFQTLRDAGVILDSDQVCPLCDYQEIPTLSTRRIAEIVQWDPIRQAVANARKTYRKLVEELERLVKQLHALRYDLIPNVISGEGWAETVDLHDQSSFSSLRLEIDNAASELSRFDEIAKLLISDLNENKWDLTTEDNFQEFFSLLPIVRKHALAYSTRFKQFEEYIGTLSNQDQQYTARELWLNIAEKQEILIIDLTWEAAKKNAQYDLSIIREALISVRQTYLESQRLEFSQGITDLWGRLRSDQYSSFSKLFIPEPRGRGFPVKIEVKALLDNKLETHEVDALSVFSESQINAVGIAAFVTRSKLLDHGCLVFDDPVQSMDEEHFKTFAREILSHLCDEGFQIIVLTHSDLFAREISYAHIDRPEYVTMSISHSRRRGCYVEEGNRRVIERLNRAEDYAEDGKLQQAWYYVRIAIERLYTVVQIKHGPSDFKPSSWANHTAEAMWNEGLEPIFEKFAPNSSQRLREILEMTVGGAHDKLPDGYTNLINAVNEIRPLLNELRVGG